MDSNQIAGHFDKYLEQYNYTLNPKESLCFQTATASARQLLGIIAEKLLAGR